MQLIEEQKAKKKGKGKIDWRLLQIEINCKLMDSWMKEITATLDNRHEWREEQILELEAKIVEKFTELLSIVSQMKEHNNTPSLFSTGKEEKKEEKE